jgi:hypothetical protein
MRAVNLGAERIPGRTLELTPRGLRAARIFVFQLPAALAGCSGCGSWPRHTSQRPASSPGEGARSLLGCSVWQRSDRAWWVWCAPGQELRNREFLIL